MRKASIQAWAFTIGGTALIAAILYATLGPPGTPDGAGEAVGRVFANTGLAALFTWMVAKKKDPPWSWLKFGAIWLVWVVALAVLTTIGRARAADAAPLDVPYAATAVSPRLT